MGLWYPTGFALFFISLMRRAGFSRRFRSCDHSVVGPPSAGRACLLCLRQFYRSNTAWLSPRCFAPAVSSRLLGETPLRTPEGLLASQDHSVVGPPSAGRASLIHSRHACWHFWFVFWYVCYCCFCC